MRRASLYDPFTGQENIDLKEKLMFLISPAYCNLLRKMAVGLTGNHKLTVQFLPPGHPEMGMTDGSRIMINTLHQKFVNEPIEKITEDTERDNYMTPEEAKAYGLVDEVVNQRAK